MSDNVIRAFKVSEESESEQDPELPSYSEKGRILVQIQYIQTEEDKKEFPYGYKYELEVLEYEGSCFWIQEGIGFDYFFDTHFEDSDFPEVGFYVVEGVYGEYTRGEWGFTDDDEDWYHDGVRKATPEEVDRGLLAQ